VGESYSDMECTDTGRHTVTETVTIGEGPHRVIETGDGVTHISGKVEIEVSGAATDRPHTYELVEAIENAIGRAVEEVDDA
jgi:hypothetical protein